MKNKEKVSSILFVLICILVVASPVAHNGIWAGFDWQAHTLRFTAIKNAFSHGQIPPTFDYWTDTQYAYPWSIFYAPLSNLYFMTSIFTMPGMSNESQLKLSFLLIIITACISSFYVAMSLFNSYKASAMASVMFLTTGYFLSNTYIRFSVGELLAISITPIYIYGLICIAENKEGKWNATIGATLIALANIPMFICSFVYFLIMAFLFPRSFFNKLNVKFYLKSAAFIVGASCFYWAPIIYQSQQTGIYAFSGLKNSYEYMYKVSANILEVFAPIPTTSGSSIGKLLSINTISLITCIYLFIRGRNSPTENKLFFASLIGMVLSTNLFPWFLIPDSVPVLGSMQFPWRMIGISAFGLCLVSCRIADSGWKVFSILFLICISLTYFPLKKAWSESFRFQNSSLYVDYLNKAAYENRGYLFSRENRMNIISIKPSYFKDGYPVYEAKKGESIVIPAIWYAGYFAVVNGRKTEVMQNNLGLVSVGEMDKDSIIEIGFDTKLINASYLISLLTMIIFVFYRSKAPR